MNRKVIGSRALLCVEDTRCRSPNHQTVWRVVPNQVAPQFLSAPIAAFGEWYPGYRVSPARVIRHSEVRGEGTLQLRNPASREGGGFRFTDL